MHSHNHNNAARYPLPASHARIAPTQYTYWLQVYLFAGLFCNFLFLFWDGNGGDIGFWEDWIRQLMNKGYQDFNGNYPPVYIHWLYVAGQLYSALNIPVENNIFLKYIAELPVMLSHLLLVAIVFQLLKKYALNAIHFHAAMLLTAANPAILFNGPIWGQIDALPLIPIVFALLAGISLGYKILAFPLFCLGLLTKFQMIAFAPVFGILFFLDYKTHLKAIILCAAVFFIAFLPSILAHNFVTAFKLAYVDVLHQYGATTMGASNIWILLTGNAAPDSIILFGIASNNPLAPLFKAKHFGMISFSLVCLITFLQGVKNVYRKKYSTHPDTLANDILFYAMICSMAFFTLLPAMHERYLLPAVIISLIYFAINPTKIFYALAFTFISAFNLGMAMGIKTSTIWPVISWLMLAAFFYALMELFFKRSWSIFLKDVLSNALGHKGVFLLVCVFSGLVLGNHLFYKTKIQPLVLADNQIALTHLQPSFTQQDYGQLQINKSNNGTVLSVAGKRFENGLGTHANSQIDYALPENTVALEFIAGLDDQVESASVTFSVWGDNQLLWQSSPMYGAEKNTDMVKVSLNNIKTLSLRVSGDGNIDSDHADWIQPLLTVAKP